MKYIHKASAGFTLVEMLLALAVLGMTAAIVVFNAPQRRSVAQQQAQTFAARLQLAQETVILTGTPLRLDLDAKGYEFFRFEEGEWRSKISELPPGGKFLVHVDLQVGASDSTYENQRYLGAKYAEETENRYVLIDPIGAVTPFSVLFSGEDPITVSMKSTGVVQIGRQ